MNLGPLLLQLGVELTPGAFGMLSIITLYGVLSLFSYYINITPKQIYTVQTSYLSLLNVCI